MMHVQAATELFLGDTAGLAPELVAFTGAARLQLPVCSPSTPASLFESYRKVRFRLDPRLPTMLVAVVETNVELLYPIGYVNAAPTVPTSDSRRSRDRPVRWQETPVDVSQPG
jgi:hypothetical protein